jgi:hypothetical protein
MNKFKDTCKPCAILPVMYNTEVALFKDMLFKSDKNERIRLYKHNFDISLFEVHVRVLNIVKIFRAVKIINFCANLRQAG